MLLQEHPRDCQACPKNRMCELQRLVESVGIDFPYAPPSGARPPVKPGGAYFERDYSLCVHCGRCVRVCHEVRGARAIVFREIGGRPEVSTPFDRPLEDAGCQFCGACVDVCPTGALRENLGAFREEPHRTVQDICGYLADIMLNLYTKEQPLNQVSAICPVCTAGCRMKLEINDAGEIVRSTPDIEGPANHGQACVQGRFLLKTSANRPDRLGTPLARDKDSGEFVETDWENALNLAAERFKGYAPGEVAVLTDGAATNEELYLLQKFARTALRTNALGCLFPPGYYHASKALREDIGMVAASNSFDDLAQARCILAVGFNPAASQPIIGVRIREAVMNGAKLIVVNPAGTGIARYADVHLPCAPGTEFALVSGLLRAIIEQDGIDSAFASRNATELDALKAGLADFDLAKVCAVTGVSHETMAEAANIMVSVPSIAVVYGLGTAALPSAPDIIHALTTLIHAKQSFGTDGGGIFPALGTANAQGVWDMGMISDLLPGQIDLADKKERKRFSSAWKAEIEEQVPACLFEDLAQGKIKALFVAMESRNEELLERIRPLMGGLEFVALMDVVAPKSGTKADVVLPMASLLEKEGSITSLERRVQAVHPALPRFGDSQSLQWVLAELARRMGVSGFAADKPEAVLKEIARLVPQYGGITAKRLQNAPLQWPCANSKQKGTPVLFTDGKLAWRKWKPESASLSVPERTAEYPFRVIAVESLAPYTDGPLPAEEARTAAALNGAIVMNPADAFTRELKVGEDVRLKHSLGEDVGRLAVSMRTPPGSVAVSADMGCKVIKGLNLVIKISFAGVENK